MHVAFVCVGGVGGSHDGWVQHNRWVGSLARPGRARSLLLSCQRSLHRSRAQVGTTL